MAPSLDHLAAQVNFQSLRDYLKARQWSLSRSKRQEVAIFRSPPPGPAREVLVPLDRELDDYAQAIQRAALTLGEFELTVQMYSDMTLGPVLVQDAVLQGSVPAPSVSACGAAFNDPHRLTGRRLESSSRRMKS